MHRQIGGPAMAWQAAQANSTFERVTPSAERDQCPFPETIALNSESDQSLREAVEVKSSQYLGPVSLTNERPSRLLQAAHLAIADQSPFNLRNTDPKLSLRDFSLSAQTSQKDGAPRVVAEVVQSPVPVPLPPRSNFDAAGRTTSLPAAIENPNEAGAREQSAKEKVAKELAAQSYAPSDGYRSTTESYRGAESYRPVDTHRASKSIMPAVTDISAAPAAQEKPSAQIESGHVHAAWGLPEEPSALRGALNSFLPSVGNAPKKSSVSFEPGMPAAKSMAASGDTNNMKAIKAGDALHTGRMGNLAARSRDTNRMQTVSSLPLFDATSMRSKFQGANVALSKSISPDGERMQVQTAPDFSSITEIWTPAADGFVYKSIYRDELNRVRYEEQVNEQGLRTIVQTGYCDKEDKKSPFVAYKMVIKPDGSRELLA